jgi:hypothetical protein
MEGLGEMVSLGNFLNKSAIWSIGAARSPMAVSNGGLRWGGCETGQRPLSGRSSWPWTQTRPTQLQVLESRKEWLAGSSGRRNYYTTRLAFYNAQLSADTQHARQNVGVP